MHALIYLSSEVAIHMVVIKGKWIMPDIQMGGTTQQAKSTAEQLKASFN